MARPPAVVIIARHGPRLDAVDQSWHLSTPTPYDPPLTYGGWNQTRSLGIRIASLLHAREQERDAAESSAARDVNGIKSWDFATANAHATQTSQPSRKRKRQHKVVIHSSPFLRCLQTSVGIAAGMAQYKAPGDSNARPEPRSKNKQSARARSGSPGLHKSEHAGTHNLTQAPDAKHDFAHAMARRALHEHKRHRKAKLRVDAFLGEWLNPSYYDHITPPPPSPMMVAAAKAELLHTEPVDIFTPSSSSGKSSPGSTLWSGANSAKQHDGASALDEWHVVEDALLQPAGRRERSSSVSSVGSNESNSSRRPHHRHAPHGSQHLTSTIPKPEISVYVPPTPHYAVSPSDLIPRGYVANAKAACVNADLQWDSSRPPQNWGDGGEFGEEWSAMHKRFRKGLNNLVTWYSQHNADDRAEDALGFEQAERHYDDDDEELVLILVTHSAGSNALIGGLTGQPVLLDVGMASLTMAVRKDDAVLALPADLESNIAAGMDIGLSSMYDMKLVSSSEHLRPGANPARLPSTTPSMRKVAPPPRQRLPSSPENSAVAFLADADESGRNTPNSSLGSIRRPSVAAPAHWSLDASKSLSTSAVPQAASTRGSVSGLWTPPALRTPQLQPTTSVEDVPTMVDGAKEDRADKVQTTSTPGPIAPPKPATKTEKVQGQRDATPPKALAAALNGTLDDKLPLSGDGKKRDSVSELPRPGEEIPSSLSRGLSQRGLWGSKPAGDKVPRRFGQEPKRRWTVNQDDAVL